MPKYLVTFSRITLLANIRSIILLPICNINLKYSVKSTYFFVILDSLNKGLENNRDKNLDHFHTLYISLKKIQQAFCYAY